MPPPSTTARPPPLEMIQRAEVEQEAPAPRRRLGLAVDLGSGQPARDEMLVNAIASGCPVRHRPSRPLLEAGTLNERTDLLVQLMQFHRAAVNGGVDSMLH